MPLKGGPLDVAVLQTDPCLLHSWAPDYDKVTCGKKRLCSFRVLLHPNANSACIGGMCVLAYLVSMSHNVRNMKSAAVTALNFPE